MAGSDHMSWTRFGYPACAATEGNPMAGGAFPGHLDGYIHTSKDRMDVRDEKGVFSVPVSPYLVSTTFCRALGERINADASAHGEV